MSDFYVGQKVTRIDAAHALWPTLAAKGVRSPDMGPAYTVRAIAPIVATDGKEYTALWFSEIANPPAKVAHNGVMEPGFWAVFFRPLESKAIAIFRAIAANPDAPLPGSPAKETADLALSQAISQPFSLR